MLSIEIPLLCVPVCVCVCVCVCVSGVPSEGLHGDDGRGGAGHACPAGWATAPLQRETEGTGQATEETRPPVSKDNTHTRTHIFLSRLSRAFQHSQFCCHAASSWFIRTCSLLIPNAVWPVADTSLPLFSPAVLTASLISLRLAPYPPRLPLCRREETARSPARRGPGRPRKRKSTPGPAAAESSKRLRSVPWYCVSIISVIGKPRSFILISVCVFSERHGWFSRSSSSAELIQMLYSWWFAWLGTGRSCSHTHARAHTHTGAHTKWVIWWELWAGCDFKWEKVMEMRPSLIIINHF